MVMVVLVILVMMALTRFLDRQVAERSARN